MNLPFYGEYAITQTFEEHNERRKKNGWTNYNGGIDYAMPTGTPIYTCAPGTVVLSGDTQGGYGRVVKISHGHYSTPYGTGELESLYAHLSSEVVIVGGHVPNNLMIGRSGNTGNSTGPHLHFEVRLSGIPIDPDVVMEPVKEAQPDTIQYYVEVKEPRLNVRIEPSTQAGGKTVFTFIPYGMVVGVYEDVQDAAGNTWGRVSKTMWIALVHLGVTMAGKI